MESVIGKKELHTAILEDLRRSEVSGSPAVVQQFQKSVATLEEVVAGMPDDVPVKVPEAKEGKTVVKKGSKSTN